MTFVEFRDLLAQHFNEMLKNEGRKLFVMNLDKDVMWNLYLDSYPAGTNEIFRVRREHDCSCCRNFIKNIGNVVTINEDNEIETVWNFQTGSDTFQPVVDALNDFVKKHEITDNYVCNLSKIGTESNIERLENGLQLTWDHFCVTLPESAITHKGGVEINSFRSEVNSARGVFDRELREFSVESIEQVLSLIQSDNLYKGIEWKEQLETLLNLKKEYESLSGEDKKINYAWRNAVGKGRRVAKLRNTSMGTLLIDYNESGDLPASVRAFEKMVGGENYKRPKPVYSQRQLDEQKEALEKAGYLSALARRHANAGDIRVNDILFCNRDASKRVQGALGLFDEMATKAVSNKKADLNVSRAKEIGIEDFIKNVLPEVTDMDLYFEGNHEKNLVSIIAPQESGAKSLFKWDNPYSWAYSGNVADSVIKQNVKNKGGAVDGVCRFSIQWNDVAGDWDQNDLDAHCVTPSMRHISYQDDYDSITKGELDVDIIHPVRGEAAVENITFPNYENLEEGDYRLFVRCFSNRGGRTGFRAEIECAGQITSFECDRTFKTGEDIEVAVVNYSKANGFTVKEILKGSAGAGKTVWNVETRSFVPVTMAMYSPNYWEESAGTGNKHYMFMLKDCINDEQPNGFYNEYIKDSLLVHKGVFEALGGKLAVASAEDQLSGVGFSSTLRNDVVLRINNSTNECLTGTLMKVLI